MPFHAVTTLSSRAGCGRRLRAASSAERISPPARRIVGVRGQLQGRGAVLERPLRRDREQLRGPDAVLLAEDLRQLGGRPGVGQTLDAVRVGVQRRGEPALRRAQVAQQELRGLLRHPPGEGGMRARDAGEVGVDPQQQRVVVEHLLEVRHDPARVDAVAGETARELVVHAAAGHPPRRRRRQVQRLPRARALVVAQQELQRHRRRELRRATEPAVHRVELAGQCLHGGVQRLRVETCRRQCRGGVVGQLGGDLPRGAAHPRTVVGPRLRDGGEQAPEVHRRVVGAAVEGLPRRGEEAGHRPTTLPGHRLGGRHVDRVDVGPLLAVDLDGDEPGVDLLGRRGVLERLVGHDVAPVAGRVADREQHGHVPAGGLLERRVRPLPPVDGIVGVLQQVRARCTGETVRHGSSLSRDRGARAAVSYG